MKTKLSPKFWVALTLFSLIGQVAWVVENMYFNVFIYKMFHASAGDISLMVAASAVAATLTTVLVGAYADRVGKRKIFICAGYILWGIFIFSFVLLRTDILGKLFPMVASSAALGVTLTIIMDCVMTFFGSSANDAAFNAWLTDSADSTNRGAVESINAMMPLVAILVVFGGFMGFNLDEASSWTVIFAAIGTVVTLVGVLGFFLIEESPVKPSETGYWQNVVHGFLPSTVKRNGTLYLSLAAFILFNIAIQIFMPYLILYYEVSLQMADYVLIMAPAAILASVVTAFWGKVYDKKGYGFSGVICLLWMILGFVLLYLFKTKALVFVGSLLMMCGYLSGMAVFGARIRDYIPAGKAGMFQGVRICAQVLIPGLVGPYIGKTVLKNAEQILNSDGTYSFVPNENIFLAALAVTVLVLVFLLLTKGKKPCKKAELTTPFEDADGEGWEVYPRPQMKRDSYLSLCGKWDLRRKSQEGEEDLGEITVPYPPESRLSGVQKTLNEGERWIYKKVFSLPENFRKDRVLLHFGAVDQVARVWLNGNLLEEHRGGYLPFTLDITPHLFAAENTLVVEVQDDLDFDLPYGKQKKNRGGMWYTPTSGIWQPVWLESVCESYIQSIRITPTMDSVTIRVEGGKEEKVLTLEGKDYPFTGESITVQVENPHLWSPEDPYLYAFTLLSGEDRVESYFALREISVKRIHGQAYICLNGKPYFFHGLLDQGYFPDGIYLPATPRGLRNDVMKMKELGFNMLRKHIKVEPDLFYYYCDKYGMAVFQDMVNSGKYSFLVDTALPTIGLKKGITHRANAERRAQFEEDCRKTAKTLYNHPSVVYYTIFNEGWGQYDADRIFGDMKALDSTRIWDATSGWFWEKESDVYSHHVYFKEVSLKKTPDRPVVLSEFGGYAYAVKGHIFNPENAYGYKTLRDEKRLNVALERLYLEEIVPAIEKGLNAAVLTQVSDVEDEINGLLTYDRQVCKVDKDAMLNIAVQLKTAFAERTK